MDHTQQISSAKQQGYDDAIYDGMYLPETLECQCAECLAAYDAGQQEGVDEIFATRGITNVS